VATPADRNVKQQEAEEKINARLHVCTEIKRMWKRKYIIIPVINGDQWKSNERFKEKFKSHNRKIFNRFTTKDSSTWNIIREVL
jgi:hypothetical protein